MDEKKPTFNEELSRGFQIIANALKDKFDITVTPIITTGIETIISEIKKAEEKNQIKQKKNDKL